MIDVSDFMYPSKKIIEPAFSDHPAFLMGEKGERVETLEIASASKYKYKVIGPTNPDKPWFADRSDLMRTKPFSFN